MASLEKLRKERIKKLEILKERGINPYPATSLRDTKIADLLVDFDGYPEDKELTIAGRVMAVREHGGSAFVDLYDGTGGGGEAGKIQCFLTEDDLGEEFELFKETVDIGDFLDVTGTPLITKRGEKSVKATRWVMLAKSLRPLPEKWHGLQDNEERLRKRYLDILFNQDVREMVERKARFWGAVRNFMEENNFTEVHTPVLEHTTGGADAKPFVTHHNALDMDVYLRISAGELWQKKLMVAGLPKVYEIGRIFRNEGMSHEHLQDYTQMEFYWAYADYEDGMEFVEELFKHVAQETFGTLQFEIGEHTVDLGDKWERYDYVKTIQEKTGIDVLEDDLKTIDAKLEELGVDYDTNGHNRPRAIDALWKYCRKTITGPGFLVGVPKQLSPLAKVHPDNPRVTERFQTIIAGTELSNGYSELNDPLDQKERFEKQQKMRDEGDPEAQMMDEDFVEALEHGMPPTCGFGMSERVFSFLANRPIREAQIFPLMKPKDE